MNTKQWPYHTQNDILNIMVLLIFFESFNVLVRLGLNYCKKNRHAPGELLHLDTKKLARFNRPGYRVTGDVTQSSRRPGYHALHVAIDDHSRVGFSPDPAG